MTLTARQFVLEILSARRTHIVSVKGMIRGGQALGVAHNSIRVAVARLKSDGLVVSVGRGTYRLGPKAEPIYQKVNAWRRVDDRITEWDGTWIGACDAPLPRTDRKSLRRRERAYRLLGFRELTSGLSIRPNNLVGGVEAARADLYRLGLDEIAPVFGLFDLERDAIKHAKALWDTRELNRSYKKLIREIETSQERLQDIELDAACAETFLIGRRAIRTLVFDPLLPAPLVKSDRRADLVAIMQDYDETAHDLWEELLDAA